MSGLGTRLDNLSESNLVFLLKLSAYQGTLIVYYCTPCSHVGYVMFATLTFTYLPHIKVESGHTGFHLAAVKGFKEVTKVLLELKASVSVIDHHGCTPLHLAASYGNYEVAKMILSLSDHSNVHTSTKVPCINYFCVHV